ncbi:MAG: sugar ABC transporter permease [Chloroflexi bacterium]|nr:sugar ABC transporter permease [Chloroflexota bacterium]
MPSLLVFLGFLSLYVLVFASFFNRKDSAYLKANPQPIILYATGAALANILLLRFLLEDDANRLLDQRIDRVLLDIFAAGLPDMNTLIVGAFVLLFAMITGNAIVERFAPFAIRELDYRLLGAGIGMVIGIVVLGLIRDQALESVWVVIAGFLYVFMVSFSLQATSTDERERANINTGFNGLTLSTFGLAIALSGTLMLRTFSKTGFETLLMVLSGFMYVYIFIFGSSLAARETPDEELPLPPAALNVVGLALGGLYALLMLFLRDVADVSDNFIVPVSLVLLYLFVTGESLLNVFSPTKTVNLQRMVMGALAGLVMALIATPILITANNSGLQTIDHILAALVALYMMVIVGLMGELVFVRHQRDPKVGTLLGGITGLVIGLASIAAQNAFLAADIVRDTPLYANLELMIYDVDVTPELLASLALVAAINIGGALLFRAILQAVISDEGDVKRPERILVFYNIWDILMAPLELLLLPVQQKLGVRRMAYFFILPNMLIFGVFILMPMILNFYFGFTRGTSIVPINRWEASGEQLQTRNIETILTCEDYRDVNSCEQDRFWRAARNTLTYVSFQVGTMVVLALLTAVALNRNIRFRGFFRSIFFYPVLLSPVVVAYIWIWILDLDNGLVNGFLEDIGQDRINFLANQNTPNWSRFWVIAVADWAFMGFFTLILLAGLQSIPASLYEAAEIDGANALNRFRFVTMPLLMPTMTVVLVLALIRAVQAFDQVFVLTGGGPGTATLFLVQYIYQSAFTFSPPNYGLASSASLLLAIVLFIATLAQLVVARRTEAA